MISRYARKRALKYKYELFLSVNLRFLIRELRKKSGKTQEDNLVGIGGNSYICQQADRIVWRTYSLNASVRTAMRKACPFLAAESLPGNGGTN